MPALAAGMTARSSWKSGLPSARSADASRERLTLCGSSTGGGEAALPRARKFCVAGVGHLLFVRSAQTSLPMPSLQDMPLETLHAHAVHTFRKGGGSRPEVVLVEAGGARAVLKDYSHADPGFRRLVGPLLVWREALALKRLAGQRGVPPLLHKFDGDAILVGHIEGQSAKQCPRGTIPPEFFERFYRLVDEMHARGVAHCDLRSEGNILVTPSGDPAFVDFVAHMGRPSWWNLPLRWAYARLCEADRVAVARLKRTHAPDALTPEELAALARDRNTPLERFARMLGKSIRNVTRLLLTRRVDKR
jgi:hypothetical protein